MDATHMIIQPEIDTLTENNIALKAGRTRDVETDSRGRK
jgi:hypothetical protein